MMKNLLFIASLLITVNVHSQPEYSPDGHIKIPDELLYKIGSGELLKNINQKISPSSYSQSSENFIEVIIYSDALPDNGQLTEYYSKGVLFDLNTWIPPLKNHPLGFFFAKIPITNFIDVLSLSSIKKIDTAEEISFPQNNQAVKKIKADNVWELGYTGSGIRIAVLDSGLDTNFIGTEFPSSIQKKDYSSYPTLDDDIENRVTGHGTHVTGSVLSKGILSENNIVNGEGPYKGVAPNSDLIFLKIGNDVTAGASTSAITEALKAAINIYNADVITMSYGSWDIYHDGSNIKDQTVDWCYSQGVPVFIPAGNYGGSKRHFSGIVQGNDSTGFIEVEVTNALPNSTTLYFNLIWNDGFERKNLTLKYYNHLGEEINNVYFYNTTESIRGTESRYSHSLFKVPEGNSIYYLKVINNSISPQEYHIYESYNDGKVTFVNDDPDYTIISPATSDHAFTVGSYVSRIDWISYDGSTNSSSQNPLENIYSFSGRGPRIDGYQKPDIVAPGSSIISLRDGDINTVPSIFFIDNDGNTSGEYNYLVMEGTSMSAPFCAGAAALYLEKNPNASPEEVYDALRENAILDEYTGDLPSNTYGYGKLDIYSAMYPLSDPLPVELSSFTGSVNDNSVILKWRTATEINNFGFEIERAFHFPPFDKGGTKGGLESGWEKIGFVQGHGNSNSPIEYFLIDDNLKAAGNYSYRLKQIDNDGTFKYSDKVSITFIFPEQFVLMQNYPNPFNPATKIKYRIPLSPPLLKGESGEATGVFITLKVYDILGNEIATLVNELKPAGIYEAEFDASLLPTGVYFYKLEAESFISTKKMLFLK